MIEKYDYSRYRIERLSNDTKQWIEVPAASISYAYDYQPNDDYTLIVGIETISLTVEFQGPPPSTPLFPTEQVRERYNHNGAGYQIWGLYTVDKTKLERIPDHSGDVSLGKLYRYRFTASLVGKYGAMMDLKICKLPEEDPDDRLKRFGITIVSG